MDSTAAKRALNRFLDRYPDSIYDFLVVSEGNILHIKVQEPLHQFRNAGEVKGAIII